MAVKIIVDSTSYIPQNIKELFDINVVSLSVVFQEESFKELEITNEQFYKKLDESSTIPKSSQPSIDEFYQAFEKQVSQGHAVVGVFISSDMSGTFNTAHIVKEMILEDYPNAQIELIDSRSNCMQAGYVAITAARLAKDDKSFEEVVRGAKETIKRSRFVFSPATLEYLKKGGRIGAAQAIVGSLLQIKPILTVKNGKTDVITKVRTKKRAMDKMVNIFMENILEFGLGEVIVHHINCEENARELANKIETEIDKTVNICSIGPVIGTHVGPGALGIAYYTKEPLVLK